MITISLAHLKILPNAHTCSFCLLRFALCLLICSWGRAPLGPTALCLLTCFSSYLAASSQTAVPLKAPSQDDRILRAVVQLVAVGPAEKGENRECSATGFLINEEGYLITNAHVVEDAKRCLERAPGAKILAKLAVIDSRTAKAVRCELVGIDAGNDLALLKTEGPPFAESSGVPPYAPLDVREVAVKTPVLVSGHPEFSWQPVTQAGRVVRRGQAYLAGEDAAPSDVLELDIPLRPGNSGSPVYRQGGGVIAIVDQKDSLRPSHAVAVSIRYAIALAKRCGVKWHADD